MQRLAMRCAAALLVGGLAACETPPFEGENVPKRPPDTEITAGPPSLERTDFRVEFHWTGRDLDGEVIGYEWRISDNGPDGLVDVADTLESLLPWNFTTANDSIFEVEADLDSFRVDVDGGVDGEHIRSWQTHTLFVRAIDDQGLRDPTPAHTSFTATTLAPNIRISIPKLKFTSSCISSAPVLTFGWKATDPDAPDTTPAATRYIRVPVEKPDGFCLIRGEFEEGGYISADDPAWSPWIPYDPLDPETHTVSYPPGKVGERYLFAVQARDVAGAETPTFTWNENVRHVRISESKIPSLIVSEPLLGSLPFVGTRNVRGFEIIGGLPLSFSWEADASEYAGTIDAYRWGLNISNREDPNDAGWAMKWGNTPAHWETGRLVFEEGYHELLVEARDNSGSRVSVAYALTVIPIPERLHQKQLLVVEDYPVGTDPNRRKLEERWQHQLTTILENQLRYFTPQDLVEVEDPFDRLEVKFRDLVRYQAVIWFLSPSNQTYYLDEFVYGGNGVHWLDIYQRKAGNLLVFGPGSSVTTRRRPFWGFNFPLIFPEGTWIHRAFCVELADQIRPPIGNIIGEDPQRPLRDLECHAIYEATLAPEYISRYPTSNGAVPTLRANIERNRLDREWFFPSEEIYNHNGTRRNVNFLPRDCQVPMFRGRSRVAAGVQQMPADQCPGHFGEEHSLIEGAPIAIASSSYAEEKPLRGSEDFLWGFHPFAFQLEDLEQALRFILAERWDMEVF